MNPLWLLLIVPVSLVAGLVLGILFLEYVLFNVWNPWK